MEVQKRHLLAAMRKGMRFDGERFTSDRKGLLPFSPPVLQASFEAASSLAQQTDNIISPKRLEDMADIAREQLGQNTNVMPLLRPSVLMAALSEAIANIETEYGSTRNSAPLALRAGLQISGVRIAEPRGSSLYAPVRLSNVRLPFSLRLIGCAIEAPLALSNCEVVTLDLSGSAMVGLDATFLKATGSVRLRRSYIASPADFGGAQIHGYFDATDSILKPFGKYPPTQSFDGDRGMLNLSQATIDNEVRLDRATIWGGLSIRALTTGRSIFLSEAVILSPMAVVEALAAYKICRDPSLKRVSEGSDWTWTIDELTTMPDSPKPELYVEGRQRWARTAAQYGTKAFTDRSCDGWKTTPLWCLLTDDVRSRTSAVRGEGCTINGNMFATALTCHGRIRLKYATISGGAHLESARLRSVESMRRFFDDLSRHYNLKIDHNAIARPDNSTLFDIAAFRLETYRGTVSVAEFERDSVAVRSDYFCLDIRDATFGGSVRIGTDKLSRETCRALLDGVVAATRAKIAGDFLFKNVDFRWSIRVSAESVEMVSSRPAAPQSYRERIAAALEASNKAHREEIRRGARCSLKLDDATIGGSLELDGSTGLCGLDGEGSGIEGTLSLFADIKRTGPPGAYEISQAANDCTGRMNLTRIEIGGDCRLIFDRGCGPSLQLQGATIAGELIIAAPPESNNSVTLAPDKFDERVAKDRDDWIEAEIAAAAFNSTKGESWRDYVEGRRELPGINLRNAHATVFGHLPAAWPHSGRLELAGFHYARSDGIGPLVPHPDKIDPQDESRLARFALALIILLSALGVVFAYYTSVAQYGALGSDSDASALWLAGTLMLAAIHTCLPVALPPYRQQSLPMAIPYLNLQRLERNRYRSSESGRSWLQRRFEFLLRHWMELTSMGPEEWNGPFKRRGNVYHPLETYVTAARALREGGRALSASLVEERRLRVRTGQLSWRVHLVAKASFSLVDAAAKYGFSYVRLFYASIGLVMITALVANSAVANGELVPGKVAQRFRVTKDLSSRKDAAVITDSPNKACLTQRPKSSEDCESFPSISYALDVIVPGVNMGEMENWQFKEGAATQSLKFRFRDAMLILHLLGLGLFGLFLLGLTSWLTTLIARNDE